VRRLLKKLGSKQVKDCAASLKIIEDEGVGIRAIAFQILLRATFVILNVVKDLQLLFPALRGRMEKRRGCTRAFVPEMGRRATADPSSPRSSG
jgi:hypothetical protein